ncbi:MAG TPA: ribokinase [Cyclobacteriaceae bacterium]|nr:ribokinase [Cyclobacteriaceae bacterium]
MNPKILVIGSSNTDMVIQTRHLPAPGETVLGGSFFMNPGGKGANQAVASARLGGQVIFITKVGNDIFGKQALEQFRREGISVNYIQSDPDLPSGVALITVDHLGENCIAVAPGSNASLSPADLDEAEEEFQNSAIILLQLEIPLSTVIYAVEIAARNNKRVILNPAPAALLPDALFKNLFIITPNRSETEMLTGVAIKDDDSIRLAAQILRKKGAENVIITLGSEGAYIYNDEISTFVPTTKVEAIDSTAAGDIFNGALAVAIAERASLEQAVAFANKAAAVSVTRMGAQSSAPFRQELINL